MAVPRKLVAVPVVALMVAALPLAQGAAAGSGNDFVHHLVRVTDKSVLDSKGSKSVVAECPPGHDPIGGGAVVDSPRRGVGISLSERDGGGWRAEAYEVKPTDIDWAIQAVAICAKTDGDPSTGPTGPPGAPGDIGDPGRCLCGD